MYVDVLGSSEVIYFKPMDEGLPAGTYKIKVSQVGSANVPSDYLLSVNKSGGGTGSHISIQSVVEGENGTPLPLINVKADSGGDSDCYLTSGDGIYKLTSLDAGNYSFLITDNNYNCTQNGNRYQVSDIGPPNPVSLASADATAVVRITMSMADPDRDNDGLLNSVEEAFCLNSVCLDPDDPDTDDDGLEDGYEFDYCVGGQADVYDSGCDLNPLSTDTDDDGFDDAMEIDYGSDPVLASDTPADNHINVGDINDDGDVGVIDVLLATCMVLGQYQPVDAAEWIRADVVPDPQHPGQGNAGDLLRIQQMALGI